jgi:dephospho-CoA kinase
VAGSHGGPRLVLGLTGYTCSGKSTFAERLVTKGFERISLGDLTRAAAKERNLPVRREETWELFKQLTTANPTWRVPPTLERLAKLPHRNVVVDGLRGFEETEAFRRELGAHFLLLEVRVDEEVRRARAKGRHRDVDPSTWDAAAEERWLAMDRQEVAMVDRIRPLVEVVVDGGSRP